MQKRKWYPGLDFIKFSAALAIVLEHYYGNTGLVQLDFIKYGGIAVDLFFMISGFLAGMRKREVVPSIPYKEYLVKAAGKYVAITVVTVVIYAVLGIAYHERFGEWYRKVAINLWSLLTSFLLIFKGGAVGNVRLGVNNPVWFLCVLIICHSLFYALIRFLCQKQIPVMYGYMGMIFIGLATVTYEFNLPFFNSFAGRGYYSFFLGCVLAIIAERANPKKLYCFSLALVLTYLLPKMVGLGFLYENWKLSIVFTLFIGLVLWGIRPWPKGANICRFLSGLSFEIYMWQGIFFIIQGWLYAAGIIKYNMQTFVVFMSGLVSFSLIMYLWVEQRLNAFMIPVLDRSFQILFGDD